MGRRPKKVITMSEEEVFGKAPDDYEPEESGGSHNALVPPPGCDRSQFDYAYIPVDERKRSFDDQRFLNWVWPEKGRVVAKPVTPENHPSIPKHLFNTGGGRHYVIGDVMLFMCIKGSQKAFNESNPAFKARQKTTLQSFSRSSVQKDASGTIGSASAIQHPHAEPVDIADNFGFQRNPDTEVVAELPSMPTLKP